MWKRLLCVQPVTLQVHQQLQVIYVDINAPVEVIDNSLKIKEKEGLTYLLISLHTFF